jgi:hypothetical protein
MHPVTSKGLVNVYLFLSLAELLDLRYVQYLAAIVI